VTDVTGRSRLHLTQARSGWIFGVCIFFRFVRQLPLLAVSTIARQDQP
jgi:hypothetical protein